MSIANRLKELGIILPTVAAPAANYVAAVQEGSLLFVAGQVPRDENGALGHLGKLGADCTVEQGYAAARNCAIQGLAAAQAALGNLDRIRRVVRLGGFVNSTPDFVQHPQVINGASDLIVEVFGEQGKHARAAVGTAGLPGGVAAEVEFLFAID